MIWNKLASALLSVALVAGMCPAAAFAQEAAPDLSAATAAEVTAGSAVQGDFSSSYAALGNESPTIGNPSPVLDDPCAWEVDGEGTLVVRPAEGDVGTLDDWGPGPSPFSGRQDIKRVAFEGTVKARTCSGMFASCGSLEEVDLTNLDTSEVTSMRAMFEGCGKLKSVDFLGHDVDAVRDVSRMFADCGGLEQVSLGQAPSHDPYIVRPSGHGMWWPTDMAQMFLGCSSLEAVDLSAFNTRDVEDMTEMFLGCSSLTKICASDGWYTTGVKRGEGMFSGCVCLRGASGTVYDESHVDYTYARFDDGFPWLPGTPGYLTYKPGDRGQWCSIIPAHYDPYSDQAGDKDSAKMDNPLTVSAKKATVSLKASKLKKAAKTVSNLNVKHARGKVTYKNVSTNKKAKKFKVTSKGKVKVAKGLKKGKYKVIVEVHAAGNKNYEGVSIDVSFVVRVR